MTPKTVDRLITTMFLLAIAPCILCLGTLCGFADALEELLTMAFDIWK